MLKNYKGSLGFLCFVAAAVVCLVQGLDWHTFNEFFPIVLGFLATGLALA